jgi:protein-tyrosine phosphatase
MVDLHSHILPGLDDGARSMEESLAMLRLAAGAGVTDMVATTHANDQFAFDPLVVARTIAEVQQACGENPQIHYGCELHLTPENVAKALRHPEQYSIGRRGYVLVEFSDFSIPASAGQVLGQMLGAGMVPIVAHPERNPLLRGRQRELEKWIENGCLVQVTGQSLSGRFGKEARSAVLEWMKRGLVHFVASDAHDLQHRPPGLEAAYRQVEALFGEAMARRLFLENARCVLDGRALPVRESSRKRFAFW